VRDVQASERVFCVYARLQSSRVKEISTSNLMYALAKCRVLTKESQTGMDTVRRLLLVFCSADARRRCTIVAEGMDFRAPPR